MVTLEAAAICPAAEPIVTAELLINKSPGITVSAAVPVVTGAPLMYVGPV